MMSSRVAWRAAAVVAFAATAALAVSLSRGAPIDTSFVAARHGTSSARGVSTARKVHVTRGASDPRCATSRLRIRVTGGSRNLRYAVQFTNVSAAACTMSGYPSVTAYGAGDRQVGNAAARETSAAASLVVLAPGASADAPVLASAATAGAGRCRPVTAAGLHVVAPGEASGWYVRYAFPACSATGRQAPVFLRVRAIEPASGFPVAP